MMRNTSSGMPPALMFRSSGGGGGGGGEGSSDARGAANLHPMLGGDPDMYASGSAAGGGFEYGDSMGGQSGLRVVHSRGPDMSSHVITIPVDAHSNRPMLARTLAALRLPGMSVAPDHGAGDASGLQDTSASHDATEDFRVFSHPPASTRRMEYVFGGGMDSSSTPDAGHDTTLSRLSSELRLLAGSGSPMLAPYTANAMRGPLFAAHKARKAKEADAKSARDKVLAAALQEAETMEAEAKKAGSASGDAREPGATVNTDAATAEGAASSASTTSDGDVAMATPTTTASTDSAAPSTSAVAEAADATDAADAPSPTASTEASATLPGPSTTDGGHGTLAAATPAVEVDTGTDESATGNSPDEVDTALEASLETGASAEETPATPRSDANAGTDEPAPASTDAEPSASSTSADAAATAAAVTDGGGGGGGGNSYEEEFLAALPEDIRQEVLLQQQMEQSSASVNVPPEFLAALPPELQREVIEQEMRQARQSANASTTSADESAADGTAGGASAIGADGMDPASVIASLGPQLRREVLLENSHDASFLAQLPAEVRGEAQRLRQELQSRHSASAALARPGGYSRSSGGLGRHHHGGAERPQLEGADDRQVVHAKVPRDGRAVLDVERIAVVLRLYFTPHTVGTSYLNRMMGNMCCHQRTRVYICNAILALLVKTGTVDDLAVGTLTPMQRLFYEGTAAGVVVPRQPLARVPVRTSGRLLECLLHLLVNFRKIAALLLEKTPTRAATSVWDAFRRFDGFATSGSKASSASNTPNRKGKHKRASTGSADGVSLERTLAHQTPFETLFALLAYTEFQQDPRLLGNLTKALAAVSQSFPEPPVDGAAADTAAASDADTATAIDGDGSARVLGLLVPGAGRPRTGGNAASDGVAVGASGVGKDVPPVVIPVLSETLLQGLVAVLELDHCSSTVFDYVAAVISRLSYVESNMFAIAKVLTYVGRRTEALLRSDFEQLRSEIKSASATTTGDAASGVAVNATEGPATATNTPRVTVEDTDAPAPAHAMDTAAEGDTEAPSATPPGTESTAAAAGGTAAPETVGAKLPVLEKFSQKNSSQAVLLRILKTMYTMRRTAKKAVDKAQQHAAKKAAAAAIVKNRAAAAGESRLHRQDAAPRSTDGTAAGEGSSTAPTSSTPAGEPSADTSGAPAEPTTSSAGAAGAAASSGSGKADTAAPPPPLHCEGVLQTLEDTFELLDLGRLWMEMGQALNELLAYDTSQHMLLMLSPAIECFLLHHLTQSDDDTDDAKQPAQPAPTAVGVEDAAHGGATSLLRSRTTGGLGRSLSVSSQDLTHAPMGGGDANEKFFLAFIEKHRDVLNELVKKNPARLNHVPYSLLIKHPSVLDFRVKEQYFRQRLKKKQQATRYSKIRLNINRQDIFNDSYRQLQGQRGHNLRGKIDVHFSGEEGVDAGGLLREWYYKLSHEVPCRACGACRDGGESLKVKSKYTLFSLKALVYLWRGHVRRCERMVKRCTEVPTVAWWVSWRYFVQAVFVCTPCKSTSYAFA